jgi:predicted dehydrogenase
VSTLRLGLIGCGYWGPKVLRAAASLPSVEVTCLVDEIEQRARALQRQFPSADVHMSLDTALANGRFDALLVATNPATHFEIASASLAGGRHVLVEKPLASTSDECEQLGAHAHAAGLVLMVGHTFRFSPAVELIGQLITDEELGQLYYIHSQRLNLGRVRQDVDAIWNFAPHDISIINAWLGGAPTAVRCEAFEYLQADLPDVGFMTFEYGDKAFAHVHVSWLSPSKVRKMTIVGSERMVVYDDVASEVLIHDSGIDRAHIDRSFGEFQTFGEFQLIQRHGDVRIPHLPVVEPLVAQCRHFVDCIRNGEEPRSGAEEGARVVRALEAATASWREGGRRVLLDG